MKPNLVMACGCTLVACSALAVTLTPDEELGVITPHKDKIRVPEGQCAVTPDNLIREPYMGGGGTNVQAMPK